MDLVSVYDHLVFVGDDDRESNAWHEYCEGCQMAPVRLTPDLALRKHATTLSAKWFLPRDAMLARY